MKNVKNTKDALSMIPSKTLFKIGMAIPVTIASLMMPTPSLAQQAPAVMTMAATMPNPTGEITAARKRAYDLFRAITGISVAIDDARLAQMETHIAAGNEKEAAKIASADISFYDVRLRDIARKMATREESTQAPLSDFVATFVGAARDNVDARELLTGNFFYRADATRVPTGGQNNTPVVRGNLLNDIVNSNNHYLDIQNNNLSLYAILIREEGQKIASGQNATAVFADAAGLITTRGFLGAHADAGTNRRLVEYSFREFMCVEMEEWMDSSRPDDFVGRDVDRFPGGSNEKYQVTCKACHTQMDGFRQAFAFVDFVNNRVTYTPGAVVAKMNRNSDVFPEGFTTSDTRWVNYATAAKNTDKFGWRGSNSGTGINEFGRLLASSKGYSRCMTKRLFAAICKRAPGPAEEGVIRSIADEFEKDYKIKGLAETVAVSPACIAKE